MITPIGIRKGRRVAAVQAPRDRRNRRRSAMAALAVALTSLGALPAPPAVAHPTIPSAVFDPTGVSWASVRDMTSNKFSAYFDQKVRDGYMVTDLEVDVIDGVYRVGAIFQFNTDGRAWQSLRNLTSSEFHDEWVEAREDGLRLVDQETYVHGGKRLWAGVWVKNVEGYSWASRRNLTSAKFSDEFKLYRRRGFMPIEFEAYQVKSSMRHAVIWVKNAEKLNWKLWRNLTSAGFSQKFAAYKDDFRMIDVESYPTPSGQRQAGIWIENPDGRRWIQLRNLTSTGFANRWNRYLDEGYRLVDYEKYPTPNGTRHAGIWRQNSDRPDWELKGDVNNRIKEEVDDFDVPGIGVVIAQNGKILYQRGFGHADVDANVWMDSRHVQRHASVSKAIAGVLTMRLVEAGEVELDDPTGDLIPGLPAHHTHTLGQLVSNRGCVRHYPQGDDGFADADYPTALSAADEFWDDPLVCTPGEYFYSTHGYTVACAALEEATGQSVSQLIEDNLTEPFGLDTLTAEKVNAAGVRVTKIYDGNNDEVDRDKVSWKTCGGGTWSSTLDLARFGIKLLAGDILQPASLDEMWTPPNAASGYAYGWSTGDEDGHDVVAKDGAWLGVRSYIRLYPDDGLVIAVLTNRKGAHSAAQVGRDIGAMLLEWIDG